MKRSILKKAIIMGSAFLYGASFLAAHYWWWFIFIYLIPLAYWVSLQEEFSFFDGVMWGLISNGMIFWGLLIFLHEHANGFFKHFVWFFFILYLSCYAGFWLYSIRYISKTFKINLSISFGAATWFYLIAVYLFSFKIFDWRMLNMFSFPLIILPVHSLGLTLLHINLYILIALIIVHALFFINLSKSGKFAYTLLIFLSIKLVNFYHLQNTILHEDLSKNLSFFLVEKSQKLNNEQCLLQHICANSNKRYIIAPESTFSYAIDPTSAVMKYLDENLADNICIFGAHRKDGDNLFNSLFVVHNGQIIDYYDKKILMPFAEYIPSAWQWLKWSKELLLAQKDAFTQGLDDCKIIKLDSNISIVPSICSEFFFTDKPFEQNFKNDKNIIYLCLANDSWFSCQYVKKNLELIARYRAATKKIPMIYVAHSRAFIKNEGQLFVQSRESGGPWI